MRAAALTDDHGFEVVTLDDPTPGPGELVLRVTSCGICGSDLKAHTHMPGGTVLGHELSGEVVAIGAGVEGWSAGTLAAGMPLSACGRCRWCLVGDVAHCEVVEYIGVGGRPGGFAELVRVDARTTFALPASVGEHSALVEPLAVGLHAVAAASLVPGDRVLVIGGGSVGAAVTLWARRLGAGEVVVSDPAPHRRDACVAVGATGAVEPSAVGRGWDVVIECVGTPGLIQAAMDAAAVHGRVVVAGVCMAPDPITPLAAIMKELSLRFVVYYRRQDFELAARLLGAGELDVAPFVTGRVGLDGVGEAFTRLLAGAGEDRKVLVTP